MIPRSIGPVNAVFIGVNPAESDFILSVEGVAVQFEKVGV